MTPIYPCLWFDKQAEEAARFYTSIFPNSKINRIHHFTDVGQEIHGQEPGSVMEVEFSLDGNIYTAINGGQIFKFNEAISLQIMCNDQEEIDYYWSKLSEGGDPAAQQCGWLKDKYGLSWQVVPKVMVEMLSSSDTDKIRRVTQAMFKMKKLDIQKLQNA